MKSSSSKCGVILVAFVMAGCATQTAVPVMPQFTTEAGKACARNSQATYSQCNLACGEMRVKGLTTTKQREQCLNNCNQILKDCYTSCK